MPKMKLLGLRISPLNLKKNKGGIDMSSIALTPSTWTKRFKDTLMLRSFGLLKVPMILFTSPVVEELNAHRAVVRIPLSWRTKNHWGSMYFGALAVGADSAGGILAMQHINAQKPAKFSLVFKDFKADFLRRPTEDVRFVCEEGEAIAAMVAQADKTGERQNYPLKILAFIASEKSPVATFTLTLSIKRSA
jgi:acyl-coenzyme A thioesterase PaaI-like protein